PLVPPHGPTYRAVGFWRLLQSRAECLVFVFLAVPKHDGRSVFGFALTLHINAEERSFFLGQSLHAQSFKWKVDEQELGLRSIGLPRIFFRAMNDEQAHAATRRLIRNEGRSDLHIAKA